MRQEIVFVPAESGEADYSFIFERVVCIVFHSIKFFWSLLTQSLPFSTWLCTIVSDRLQVIDIDRCSGYRLMLPLLLFVNVWRINFRKRTASVCRNFATDVAVVHLTLHALAANAHWNNVNCGPKRPISFSINFKKTLQRFDAIFRTKFETSKPLEARNGCMCWRRENRESCALKDTQN